MSMSSQGPGWWVASDGRWYPPEQHPDAVAAASQQPTTPGPPVGPPLGPPVGPPAGTAPGWSPLDGPTRGAAPVPPGPSSPPPFGQAPPAPYGQPGPTRTFGPPPQFGPPQSGGPAPYGMAPSAVGRVEAPRRGPRPLRIVLAVVIVLGLLAGAGVWAVSWLRSQALAGDTAVFDLSVGDCVDDPIEAQSDDLVEVEAVEDVPCDEPHEAEVYALVDLPGTDSAVFPGEDSIAQQADQECLARFEEYVGTTYEQSTLAYSYYMPTAQSWDAGDREVACLVADYEGELITGSVRGSGR